MALRDLWRRVTGKGEAPPAEEPESRSDAPLADAPSAEAQVPHPPADPSPEPLTPEPPTEPARPPVVEPPAPENPPAPPPEMPPPSVPEPISDPIPPEITPPVIEPPGGPMRMGGFFAKLKQGLSRSTAKLTDSITGVFTKRKLDDAALEELEETLIAADLGVKASGRVVEGFRRTRFGREATDAEIKGALADEIAAILGPVAKPLVIDRALKPHVVLVVGVNGTGKTTTIAKLAEQYRADGMKVIMCAGDTFRAAAVEQLQVWGSRTGAEVVAPAKDGADAAGLAFDALSRARDVGADVLLVDTAGRLHNKTALMEELRKIVRVMKRQDAAVPHSVLLVLDATTGQNAVSQLRVFSEMVEVSGLVVTKLDGSAKGGVVVALAEEFGTPIHAVGVGETAADLRPFEARHFARALVGLE
ncbi:signal recognition particle-docking protein FtsY [Roseococcus sp. MDT2-1-1]|uniref:Signal recognition particle receptor FtsY n=1 Tax=Sabulicella glaciei TaxID=2984948 RepID=A0ABT3NUK3_9PROT|nr:signal recognition particle-docking protein FtsY [Roseococcus sp. MDT2-1-1]MCW8085841.1 signal recognition particle-docking protein FtsY [Roseococcus sp. MDT2-1-1]